MLLVEFLVSASHRIETTILSANYNPYIYTCLSLCLALTELLVLRQHGLVREVVVLRRDGVPLRLQSRKVRQSKVDQLVGLRSRR